MTAADLPDDALAAPTLGRSRAAIAAVVVTIGLLVVLAWLAVSSSLLRAEVVIPVLFGGAAAATCIATVLRKRTRAS